jgi:phosphoglycolate phosphatase
VKTIVFDLDGTLLDSAPDIVSSLQQALIEAEIEFQYPISQFVVGPPVIGMIDRLGLKRTEEQEMIAVNSFRRIYDPSPMLLTKPYSGAIEILQLLKKSGFQIFVATNKPVIPTSRLIDRFFKALVDDFCCVDSLEGRKLSKKEMLEVLSNRHNLLKDSSIMIGDGNTDIRAGSELGWKTIAVGWGYSTELELRSESPTYFSREMGEIFGYLKELFSRLQNSNLH